MLDILLKVISLVHIIFVIFVVLTPFSNINYFLMLHAIFLPFIMLHWICNDNTCVLTVIERNLRKKIYGKVDEELVIELFLKPPFIVKNDGFNEPIKEGSVEAFIV